MPPIIMLWGALCFSAWAIRRDTQQRPTAGSLWLPLLWMMRCGSRSLDYWFTADEVGRIDPLFVAAMIISGLVVLAKRRCDWRQIVTRNLAVFLFYGFLCLSETWVDGLEAPGIKTFRPLADLVMALVVATSAEPLKSIAAITRRTAFLLIPLSIVLIRYYHDLGTLQHKHWGADLWIGVTTHKNPLGQLCILSLAGLLWTIVNDFRGTRKLFQDPVLWIYIVLALYLLSGGGNPESRSTTSILTFGVAVAVFTIIGRFKGDPARIGRKVAAGATSLAVIALALQLFGTSLQAFVAEASGKDPTLTDRTYLWRDVVRIGMDHPILGSGYGGFWVPSLYSKLSPQVDNGPRQAHNGYLETFANLGLVGLALLLWIILHSLKDAAYSARFQFEYSRVRLSLLFAALVMNYAEATFTVGTHLWWFVFLIAAVNTLPPRSAAEPVVVAHSERVSTFTYAAKVSD